MNVSAKVKILLMIGVVVTLSGCATLFPSFDSRIEGMVTNATGGEAVAGSHVQVRGLSTGFTATAKTNAHGQFSIGVEPDRYEIKLSKSGYGSSHVYGVDANRPTHINIIQREAFNPRWSTKPPVVNINGVSEGNSFLGEIPYRVDVEAENPMNLLYVALGKTPGAGFTTAPRQAFAESDTSGDTTINPADYGVRGETTFEVVAYDMNGNRTHIIRYINIISEAGLILPPLDPKAIAVTLGKQIAFFEDPVDPTASTEAAQNDTNLYVELTWGASSDDVDGYRVYRSLNGVTYSRIATVGATQLRYVDSGSEVQVGRTVYYRIAAFNGGDESEWSEVTTTRPLEAFDVLSVSPSDNEESVSRTPTFRWQPTKQVGRTQIYGIVLWDTVLGESSFWVTPDPPEFTNQLSWRWNQDGRYTGTPWAVLQSERLYEWQVAYAAAVDNINNPTAVSIAVNRFGIAHPDIPVVPLGVAATNNFTFMTGNN